MTDTRARLPPGWTYVEPLQTTRPGLPPGWSYVDKPPQNQKEFETELPEGYTFHTPGPPDPEPAVNAGISQPDYKEPDRTPAERAGISIDPSTLSPHELWMMQTQQATMPPQGGRQEGPITRKTGDIIPAVDEFAAEYLKRTGTLAEKGFKEGKLSPGETIEAATTLLPMAPSGVGGRVVKGLTPQQKASLHEAGVTSVPNIVNRGEALQSMGQGLSNAPIVGAPIRRTTGRVIEQITETGQGAAARPTGAAVGQLEAGEGIRRGLFDEAATLALSGEKMPPKLMALSKRSGEDIIGTVAKMATEFKSGADLATLAQVRAAVPKGDWDKVQSALIQRFSVSPTKGGFDPDMWIRNYGGTSPGAKNILFGAEKGPGSLRYHLDSITESIRIAEKFERFKGGGALGTGLGAGGMIAAVLNPLKLLTILIPARIASTLLTIPSKTAAVSQWSSAWTKYLRTNGAPGAVSGLSIATRNLNNTLGTELTLDDILKGTQNEQFVEP